MSVMMATVFGLLPVGGLRQLDQHRQRLLGLRARRGRGLEDVLEAARGDHVRVGQRQHRQLGALGHLGDGERERAQIRAGRGDQVGLLRDHALRGVLGLLGGVAGVEHDQLELGAAQRLDAALRR